MQTRQHPNPSRGFTHTHTQTHRHTLTRTHSHTYSHAHWGKQGAFCLAWLEKCFSSHDYCQLLILCLATPRPPPPKCLNRGVRPYRTRPKLKPNNSSSSPYIIWSSNCAFASIVLYLEWRIRSWAWRTLKVSTVMGRYVQCGIWHLEKVPYTMKGSFKWSQEYS